MKIILKSIKLNNFKKFKDEHLFVFDEKESFIFGKNGAGKTTLFDAWTFVLNSKNSLGMSSFDIIPKDLEQESKVNSFIELTLLCDNEEIVIKKNSERKISKDNTVKNTNSFFYNEIPLKENQFKKKLEELFVCNINISVLSDLNAFVNLHWKEQRNILFELTKDEIEKDLQIAEQNSEFAELVNVLSKKTLEEYTLQVNSRKKEITSKDFVNLIKELSSQKKEIPVLNYTQFEVEKELNELNTSKVKEENNEEIQKLYNKLNVINEESNKVISSLNNKLHEKSLEHSRIMSDLSKKKYEINEKHNNLKEESTRTQKNLNKYTQEIKELELEARKKQNKLEELRTNAKEINTQKKKLNEETFIFDKDECKCPTCLRLFEQIDIEKIQKELEENFNTNKQKKLDALNNEYEEFRAQGIKTKEELEELKRKFEVISIECEKLQAKINEFQNSNEESQLKKLEKEMFEVLEQEEIKEKEIKKIKEEIDIEINKISIKTKEEQETYKNKIKELSNVESDSQVKEKQEELLNKLAVINKSLEDIKTNEEINKRIEELKTEEKEIAVKLMKCEQIENLIKEFTAHKINLLEEKINSKFNLLRFKLFNAQNNGNIMECCEILVNDIAYSSNLNTASKCNARIDVINTLSNHYSLIMPIFIDDRDLVTTIEIDSSNQIINSIVSEKDEVLRIENNKNN